MLFLLFITEDDKIQELNMFFTRHPQPLAAPLNDDVNFECSLNIPAERFAWHHKPLGSNKWTLLPDPKASESHQVSTQTPVGSKTSRRIVTFDNETKAGDYRCIAFFGESLRKFFTYLVQSIIHSVLFENYL